jgi:uncharacterized membrane protein (UPF0127 family)
MSLGKKIFILPLIIVFVTLVFIFLKIDFFQPSKKGFNKAYVGKNLIFIKVARTQEEREQGLSGVKTLAQDEGMLFILPTLQQPTFWMKDMNFPLDFIWIAGDKVVDLAKNVPAPLTNASNDQIATVAPNQPVDMVLEVNAGWISKQKVKIDDNFVFKE